MNEQFITPLERTTRKSPLLATPQQRRFRRQPSDRNPSTDPKRSNHSRGDSVSSQFIKNAARIDQLAISQIHDEGFSLLEKANNSFQFEKETRERHGNHYQRRNTDRQRARQDNASSLRVEMLETQMLVREGECERFKAHYEEEKERRRKA